MSISLKPKSVVFGIKKPDEMKPIVGVAPGVPCFIRFYQDGPATITIDNTVYRLEVSESGKWFPGEILQVGVNVCL